MLLSELEIGKKYLEQSDKKDQDIAKKLINRLTIIPEQKFLSELSTLLDKLTKNSAKLPAVLYPVFERRKNTSSFFENDGTPYMPEPSKVGSEGILQKFCRDYADSMKSVYFNLSLNELKKNKIRSIICVDDIIASGNRMREFIGWLYENKTIKSWHSFKCIKFIIVAYAVTDSGLKYIVKSLNIINEKQINPIIPLSKSRSFWTSKDEDEITKLCYKYSEEQNIPDKWILGFNNTFSTIIFPHSVPNTTPAIIWWGSNPNWQPLFPKSIFPSQVTNLTELHSNKEKDFFKKLEIDTNGFDYDKFSPDTIRLFVFLFCLSRKKRRLSIISEMMELPIDYVEKIRDKCIEYNWITSDLILTEQGRNVLKSLKKYMRKLQKNICINENFYYPISLRGSIALSSTTTSLKNGGSNDC